jgi:hypothetical protein
MQTLHFGLEASICINGVSGDRNIPGCGRFCSIVGPWDLVNLLDGRSWDEHKMKLKQRTLENVGCRFLYLLLISVMHLSASSTDSNLDFPLTNSCDVMIEVAYKTKP